MKYFVCGGTTRRIVVVETNLGPEHAATLFPERPTIKRPFSVTVRGETWPGSRESEIFKLSIKTEVAATPIDAAERRRLAAICPKP